MFSFNYFTKNATNHNARFFKKHLYSQKGIRELRKNTFSNMVISDKLFTRAFHNPSEKFLSELAPVISNISLEKFAVRFSFHDDCFIVSVDESQKERLLFFTKEAA